MSQDNGPEKVLIWIHGDWLDSRSPVLAAYPGAPAAFVFDEELLTYYQLSAKRVMFLYESLLEIPNIRICRGQVAEQLALVAAEMGCSRLVTMDTVAPRFQRICTQLRRQKNLPVEVFQSEPFVRLPEVVEEELDLKRFSRYWQVASKFLG